MAELPDLPAAMKSLSRYVKLADAFEPRTPAVSYYCYFHVLNEAISNHSSDNTCRPYLVALMTYVEEMKNSMPDDTTIRDQDQGKQLVRTVATAMFEKANQQDLAGQATKGTADLFYKAASLFEVMAQFKGAAEEVAEPRKYAKAKASHIIKCVKEGRQPTPGPIDSEGNPRTDVPMPTTSTQPTPAQPAPASLMSEPTVPMSSPAFPQEPPNTTAYPPTYPPAADTAGVDDDDDLAALLSLPTPPADVPPPATVTPPQADPYQQPHQPPAQQQPPQQPHYQPPPAQHQPPPAAAQPYAAVPARKTSRTLSASTLADVEPMSVACRPKAQQSIKEEELTATALKYAISSLQYHDTKTAMDYCLKALSLLTE
eukprot:m.92501 g.92501  ORF g.92501 m.92501 type:complete len:371 (+) comp14948_c0_seq1:207-1319(+)